MTGRHGLAVAIGLAAMVLIACGGDSAGSTTSEPPTTTAATSAPGSTAPTTAQPATVAVFDGGAQLLEKEFSPLDAGTYLVETLGTPFSLTADGNWFVQPNSAGRIVLTDPASSGPGDRDVVFVRTTRLSAPQDPTPPWDDQEAWPVADIAGWLDSVMDGIVTTEPASTTLGGLPATVFDVSLDDSFDCGPDACAFFADNRGVNGLWFDPGVDYRIWWVDTGDEAPIAISVGAGNQGPAFFDRARELLDTVAFGEVRPHPIPEGDLWTLCYPAEVPAGRIELGFGGGIAFELPSEQFIYQELCAFAEIPLRLPGAVDLVLPRFTPDGEAIASTDALVTTLTDFGLTLTELDATTVAGNPTRVFDLTDGPQGFRNPAVKWDSDAQGGWRPPFAGRLWVLETDRGLMMITAESFESDVALLDAMALAESVLSTLELIDLD